MCAFQAGGVQRQYQGIFSLLKINSKSISWICISHLFCLALSLFHYSWTVSKQPCCYKPPVSNCNCTCNANQDLPVILKTLETKLDRVKSLIGLNNNNNSDLSDAVKSLEAKMEGLIALINNTSCFFPPRTPKPTGNLQQKYELMLNS